MKNLIIFIVLMAILLSLVGCTLHFKSEGLEIDAERQRIQEDVNYHLSGIDFAKQTF